MRRRRGVTRASVLTDTRTRWEEQAAEGSPDLPPGGQEGTSIVMETSRDWCGPRGLQTGEEIVMHELGTPGKVKGREGRFILQGSRRHPPGRWAHQIRSQEGEPTGWCCLLQHGPLLSGSTHRRALGLRRQRRGREGRGWWGLQAGNGETGPWAVGSGTVRGSPEIVLHSLPDPASPPILWLKGSPPDVSG